MIYDTHSLSQAVTGTFIYPYLSSCFARRLTGQRGSRSSSINAPVILRHAGLHLAPRMPTTKTLHGHVSPSASRCTGCHHNNRRGEIERGGRRARGLVRIHTVHSKSTPILLKYRYRHPTLDTSLTRSRIAGKARAINKCLRWAYISHHFAPLTPLFLIAPVPTGTAAVGAPDTDPRSACADKYA